MNLDELSFQSIMTNYDIPEDFHFQDPRLEEAQQHLISESRMNTFAYNIRNACARLGNTFLLVNMRNKVEDMLLVTLDNIFYCVYNLDEEDDPVSETDKKAY